MQSKSFIVFFTKSRFEGFQLFSSSYYNSIKKNNMLKVDDLCRYCRIYKTTAPQKPLFSKVG